MVKKTFFKACLRSIRGSFSRFLAIFLIVALGAGFLAGLLATTPDMRHTVSELYHESNFYDLRVVGTLGLEDGDAEALSRVEGVRAVMPARSADREVALDSGDTLVARFHGVTAWEGDDPALMNRPELVEGRWPQADDECVVVLGTGLRQTSLDIGSALEVLPLENKDDGDEDPEEVFAHTRFTIVGVVTSSYYISLVQRGSTSMGNGSIGCVIYVNDSVLDMDYYTDLYVTVEDGLKAEAFTRDYDDLVVPVQQRIEQLAETQKHVRADRLREDAQQELDDARQELADKTAEGQQELDDALRELQDGEQEYADGLADYEQGQRELEDAFRELQDGEADLPDALQKLRDGEREYEDGLKELEDAQAEIDDNQKELDDAYVTIQEAKAQLKDAQHQLKSGEAELEEGARQLDEAQAQVDAGQAQVDAGREQLAQKQAELEAGYGYGLVSEEVYQAGMAQIAATRQYLDGQQAQLDAGQREIDSGRSALAAGSRKLADARADYEDGLKEVEDADVDRRWGLYQLELAREKLEDGRQELADARKELDDGWRDYEQGVQDLKDGWADYYDGQKELEDARTELEDARQELDDGWKEYEDGRREFDEKIADANLKIRDAQDRIDDIEDPEWHVLTRDESNESYIFYSSDAEKVAAIAKVFPVFFFLVAALVASTTMTRMIDEDRGVIGTLKALGYSNGAIAGKYLLYAALACVLGAAAGLAVFLPLLPRVIANAYTMMYQLPPIRSSSHLTFMLVSAGGILAAVLLATLGALRGSLRDRAAELMRPKAPPAGKRILLEHIKPLWRRLKFTHKVTVRNLFRYKKRFFMTVIGIAGCTAMLVAGFGLRDSIRDIVNIQFTQLQNYDLTLTMKHQGDDTADRRIAAVLSDNSLVSDFLAVHLESGVGFVPGRETDLNILVASDPEKLQSFYTFRVRTTGEPVPFTDEGAILTEKAAKVLGVEPGDVLQLRNQDDQEAGIPITGVCENYVHGYIYIPRSLYERAFGEQCSFDTVLAKTGASDEAARDALAARLLSSSNATGVSFSTATIEAFNDMLGSVDYIVIVLIVAAAVLAFVVLYNLTNINICERQKEIATLKVLGFYRREVSDYVFRENILLSLIGTAAGLFVGVFFHQFVVQTAEVDAVMFGRTIAPMSYVYAAVLSMVFTLLVSLFMRKKLHRIDMVESLKAPE